MSRVFDELHAMPGCLNGNAVTGVWVAVADGNAVMDPVIHVTDDATTTLRAQLALAGFLGLMDVEMAAGCGCGCAPRDDGMYVATSFDGGCCRWRRRMQLWRRVLFGRRDGWHAFFRRLGVWPDGSANDDVHHINIVRS